MTPARTEASADTANGLNAEAARGVQESCVVGVPEGPSTYLRGVAPGPDGKCGTERRATKQELIWLLILTLNSCGGLSQDAFVARALSLRHTTLAVTSKLCIKEPDANCKNTRVDGFPSLNRRGSSRHLLNAYIGRWVSSPARTLDFGMHPYGILETPELHAAWHLATDPS